jgi:hypothetical protein
VLDPCERPGATRETPLANTNAAPLSSRTHTHAFESACARSTRHGRFSCCRAVHPSCSWILSVRSCLCLNLDAGHHCTDTTFILQARSSIPPCARAHRRVHAHHHGGASGQIGRLLLLDITGGRRSRESRVRHPTKILLARTGRCATC